MIGGSLVGRRESMAGAGVGVGAGSPTASKQAAMASIASAPTANFKSMWGTPLPPPRMLTPQPSLGQLVPDLALPPHRIPGLFRSARIDENCLNFRMSAPTRHI